MIRPTAEQIIEIAATIGLDLTTDERKELPEHIQRQFDAFSALAAVDVDGVRPFSELCGGGTVGR